MGTQPTVTTSTDSVLAMPVGLASASFGFMESEPIFKVDTISFDSTAICSAFPSLVVVLVTSELEETCSAVQKIAV
jgi:hypothetical protein